MAPCGICATRRRATRSATARSSATCSSAACMSRRRSSRRCSSRSRTGTRRSTARWRPVPSSSIADLWETIAVEAGRESRLWREALRRPEKQEREPVFSPLAEQRYRLGLETIYEGYLLHYGRPRLFAPRDADTALLLGDYLYAHGLVRVADVGSVEAVADLGELISLCAQLRADAAPGDGAAWAATAALLGSGELETARAALRDDGDPEPLAKLTAAAAGTAAGERGPP